MKQELADIREKINYALNARSPLEVTRAESRLQDAVTILNTLIALPDEPATPLRPQCSITREEVAVRTMQTLLAKDDIDDFSSEGVIPMLANASVALTDALIARLQRE